jgi:signal transduction histidine kinase
VLSNLIDNAVRHTRDGRLHFRYANGWLYIEDTGPGIPAHAIPHVFDRFYQAGSPDTPTAGVGIGLSIVRKLCERYGWSIEIGSDPGNGTCVSLRLPAANRT